RLATVNESVRDYVCGTAGPNQSHDWFPFLISHTRFNEGSRTTANYYRNICRVGRDEIPGKPDPRRDDNVTIRIRITHILVRDYSHNHPTILFLSLNSLLHISPSITI